MDYKVKEQIEQYLKDSITRKNLKIITGYLELYDNKFYVFGNYDCLDHYIENMTVKSYDDCEVRVVAFPSGRFYRVSCFEKTREIYDIVEYNGDFEVDITPLDIEVYFGKKRGYSVTDNSLVLYTNNQFSDIALDYAKFNNKVELKQTNAIVYKKWK